jgi:hypothetical protein
VTEIATYFQAQSTGEEHIDWHLNSVYHLGGALNPKANQVGIGVEDVASPRLVSSSFSLGATTSRVVPKAGTQVLRWPVNGATNVPRTFTPAEEAPNPLPDVAPNTSVKVGTPIMLCGLSPQSGTANTYGPIWLETAYLVKGNAASTERVPNVRLLKAPKVVVATTGRLDVEIVSDDNLPVYGMEHCVFMVPKVPLDPNQLYSAVIGGGQQVAAANNTNYHFKEHSVSFTTGR